MDPNQIPYVLLSHFLNLTRRGGMQDRVPVWICLNLMDHRALGLGTDRESAIEQMRLVSVELMRRRSGDSDPMIDDESTEDEEEYEEDDEESEDEPESDDDNHSFTTQDAFQLPSGVRWSYFSPNRRSGS